MLALGSHLAQQILSDDTGLITEFLPQRQVALQTDVQGSAGPALDRPPFLLHARH